MKHSDLKVGMKVKRVSYFDKDFYAATKGNVSTVESIDNNNSIFYVKEEKGYYFEAQYFEPVEETKEKETMNTESNLISLDKKYKTRCGYPVRILCVDRNDPDYPVAALVDGLDGDDIIAYDKYGCTDYCVEYQEDYDLVEVSPYEDFKKDDKVMVSINGTGWVKRYFSHEENGVPYTFPDGMTSWSGYSTVGWEFCRKPTQEELGE